MNLTSSSDAHKLNFKRSNNFRVGEQTQQADTAAGAKAQILIELFGTTEVMPCYTSRETTQHCLKTGMIRHFSESW